MDKKRSNKTKNYNFSWKRSLEQHVFKCRLKGADTNCNNMLLSLC